MDVQGKVVLVTGAAEGLGKSFSEELLNQGAKVIKLHIKLYTKWL